MTIAALKVTIERARAEGTRSRWQGDGRRMVTPSGFWPCRSDRVARKVAMSSGGGE